MKVDYNNFHSPKRVKIRNEIFHHLPKLNPLSNYFWIENNFQNWFFFSLTTNTTRSKLLLNSFLFWSDWIWVNEFWTHTHSLKPTKKVVTLKWFQSQRDNLPPHIIAMYKAGLLYSGREKHRKMKFFIFLVISFYFGCLALICTRILS